jgi:glycosyltransferase involved in cell wall biosynthesis
VPTRFTVAIPTHDRRETVLLAVRSVLAQTRSPEQVLVLCDGCTDGTVEALRKLDDPRVEALDLPKAPGYGYAHRTASLERARGEVITWLGDDDLLLPDHLARVGELWDAGGLDLVQSHGAVVAPDDALEWFGADWSVPYFAADLERFNPSPMGSVSIRVSFARDLGGWDDALARAADWDLWRRALAAGARTAMSPEPTLLHFRATGRRQPWDDRVRQNAAYLAALEDPYERHHLRVRMRRLRAQRDAVDVEYARALRAHVAWLESENARLEGALQAIRSGGWWRLREHLLRVRRAVGGARGSG